MTTRRKFLLGGAAAVVIAGGGVVVFGRMGFEAEVVSILRRRLGYLNLEAAGLHAFARDQAAAAFAKKIPTWNRMRYHFLSAFAPAHNRYFKSNDHRSKIVRLEDTLVSTYLLSSDFFLNGADESRVVTYVAYFDPLLPCRNPFTRLVNA